ncbi:MAG: DMT family transporter [Alphaproteobacteria bacterium]|nr:DMT family transporter [Alphaproteobacteria bacterium]
MFSKRLLAARQSGYLFIILGVCLYAFSDTIMKYYMPTYGVNQITFIRTISRFVPLLIFAIFKQTNPLKSKKIGENIFRAILASIATYMYMLAYRYTSMTDVTVVGYSSAIFVIPLSVLILKEKFYAIDAWAVFIGFLGVLVAFRPGIGIFQLGTMFAVMAAVISALNQVIIRKLSSTENELTIIFYHHILLIIISLTVGFHGFSPIIPEHALILCFGGFIGVLAQYSIIHALSISTSSSLASGTYTMLIPVTILDYVIYDKIPDIFIIIGLTLILLGSSLILQKRFRK